MKVLFDTNIVIDALNGIASAHEEFASAEEHFISTISRIEVFAGYRNDADDAGARAVLARITELIIDAAVAEESVTLRRTTRLKLPDAIILATARVHGLTLSTRNTKDFSPTDPTIRIPYEP